MARRKDARGLRGMVEALEQRMLLAAAPVDYSHGATLEFGGRTKAVFVDADGDTVTVALSGAGSGVVHFNQVGDSATNLDAASIELNGTAATSVLSVKVADRTSGDIDDTGVQQINVNGSLNVLNAPAMGLLGAMTATGTLGKVTLKDVGSSTISVQGSSTQGSSFAFASASGLTLASPHQGIAAITAKHWFDGNGQGQISAPYLGSLRSDEFQPKLVLDGSILPANQKVLGSVTLTGYTFGDWQIHGDAGSISVGHFGANVTIDGAVASLKTRDNVGLAATAGANQIEIGGKASVSAAGDRISVKNGATLYTQDAATMYDLTRVASYDGYYGRSWTYNTIYSGSLGSGQVSSTTRIQGTSVYTQVGDYTVGMNWAWGSSGQALNSVEISATELGTIDLQFSPTTGTGGDLLPVKGTLTSTMPVSGSWSNPLDLNAEYGTIGVSMSGTATLSLKSMGYEEVQVPYGHYLAYKVEMKIAAKGPLNATVQGQSVSGRYNVGLTQTIWCVPGIGIVKQQGTSTVGFSAAGKSGSGTVKSTMVLTDFTGYQ